MNRDEDRLASALLDLAKVRGEIRFEERAGAPDYIGIHVIIPKSETVSEEFHCQDAMRPIDTMVAPILSPSFIFSIKIERVIRKVLAYREGMPHIPDIVTYDPSVKPEVER